MFSAASTASRTVSIVFVCSATARIFESTYSASFRMYSGSDPRRLYAWSKISTRTFALFAGFCRVAVAISGFAPLLRDPPSPLTGRLLLTRLVDLAQHLLHPASHFLAVFAQLHHLPAQALQFLLALLQLLPHALGLALRGRPPLPRRLVQLNRPINLLFQRLKIVGGNLG